MSAVGDLKKYVRDVWDTRPSIDLYLSLLIVGVHFYLSTRLARIDIVGSADTQQRLAIYAAGAGVMSLIAGFAGTAIAQYGTAAGPAAQIIRRQFGKEIRKNWISVVKWLLTSALLCIISMVLDRDKSTHGSQWLFEVALITSVFKFARMAFLFRLIMSAIDFELTRPNVKVPTLLPGRKTKPK
jgi:hypothetical protein